jgi:hypothetical protein
MKFIFLFLYSFSTIATSLQTGDILLQPLSCYVCSLIEAQEKTIYSHMGVVLEVAGEMKIAEAYGQVRIVSVQEFLSKTEKGQSVLHLRPRLLFDEQLLIEKYFSLFHERAYDERFLWHNGEKYYCSEFIYKLFLSLGFKVASPKIMSFDVNYEAWERYFKGEVPMNEVGISPADFLRSPVLLLQGEL